MVTRALACAQKKADEEHTTIVWADEAGLYLLPMAVRPWAPRGQTPVLRVKLTRAHLSAISGITLNKPAKVMRLTPSQNERTQEKPPWFERRRGQHP